MKKAATFIPYTLLLFVLFFGNIIVASAQPPPPGNVVPPPVNIDLYLIPMVVIGIILAFFSLEKTLMCKLKIDR